MFFTGDLVDSVGYPWITFSHPFIFLICIIKIGGSNLGEGGEGEARAFGAFVVAFKDRQANS